VHVSRRWRRVILAAPSLLDLHIVCTRGVPVADMLAHSPPLPLIIFYRVGDDPMTTEDEKGVLLALSHAHRYRVRRIALWMLSWELKKFVIAMDGQFPVLERLNIDSSYGPNWELILPRTFEAPNLRHIELWRVALPTQSPLLTTARGLVFLRLGGILESAYFPPTFILARLSLMP
jgi:hypothetical protein